MLNLLRRLSVPAVLLGMTSLAASSAAFAQEAKPETPLARALGKIDLGVVGAGEFSRSTSGSNYLSQSIALQPSNTLGYMATVRLNKSPYFGLGFNYGYARYSQNFTLGSSTLGSGTTATTIPAQYYGIQSNAKEFSGSYLVHPPHKFFGIQPFAEAGIGTLKFAPTAAGGEGLKQQYRMLYHAGIGGEAYLLGDHFGARAEFRELIYNAPDYLTNYITYSGGPHHTNTSQPIVGIFLRF